MVLVDISEFSDDYVTVPKAAELSGKTKKTLYLWIKGNKIESLKFGGILFIPKTEVERIKKQEAGA